MKSKLSLLRATVVFLALSVLLAACGPSAQAPSGEAPGGKAADSMAKEAGELGGLKLYKAGPKDQHVFLSNVPGAPGTPKAGGTLVAGSGYQDPHLDPVATTAGGMLQSANMVYNRLLKYKSGWESTDELVLVPDLAKEWKVSPDAKTFTFVLHDGIKWHNLSPMNGREFTSADVKYSLERYINDKASVHKSSYAVIEKIETPDPKTVVISAKEPAWYIPSRLGGIYATMFPKEVVEQYGDLKKNMIGTGPYILGEWTKGEKFFLKKNPDYFEKGKPYLDEVKIFIFGDQAARDAAFRAGQIDVVYASPYRLKDIKALLRTNPDIIIDMSPAETGGFVVAFRLDKEPFSNVDFRRAVSMALDRKAILDTVSDGAGIILPTPFPWHWAFDKMPEPKDLGPYYQYNPEEAKKLLAKAGYPNGVKINVVFTAFYGEYQRTQVEIVQDMLKKVGIEVDVKELDYSTFNQQLVNRDFDQGIMAWQGTLGADAFGTIFPKYHSTSSLNRAKVNDPELDKLVEQIRLEADPQKRKDIYKKVWAIELDKAYYPAVPGANTFRAWQPWVKNYTTSRQTSNFFYYSYTAADLWIEGKK